MILKSFDVDKTMKISSIQEFINNFYRGKIIYIRYKNGNLSLKGILLKIRRLMLSAVEFEVCILYDVYGINHIIDTLRFGENDFDYFNIEIF